MAEDRVMSIINRGRGPIVLKNKQRVGPGESAQVSMAEGKALLGYRHIADAAKVVPSQANREAKLRKENEDLAAENKKLSAQLEKKGKGRGEEKE